MTEVYQFARWSFIFLGTALVFSLLHFCVAFVGFWVAGLWRDKFFFAPEESN